MKIKIILLIILSLFLLLSVSCTTLADDKVVEGRYILKNGDGSSYITISEEIYNEETNTSKCSIQFHGIDLNAMLNEKINMYKLINKSNFIRDNSDINLSEERFNKHIEEVFSDIDLTEQYITNKSEFVIYSIKDEFSKYDYTYMISYYDGKENNEYKEYLSLDVLFYPKNYTIEFYDKLYLLE